MKPTRLHVAFAVVVALVSAPAAHAQRRYSLTPIPTAPFFTTGGHEVNDAGHVTGQGVPLGPNPYSAFYWSPETGTVSLGERSVARGLNNSDTVAGYHPVAVGPGTRAFTWNPSDRVFHDVPDSSQGHDINDAGQVLYRVGGPPLADQRNYVRNADGTVRLLPKPAAAEYAEAVALNNRGDAVGRGGGAPGAGVGAVYWPATGGVQRLAELPGVRSFGALGINDRGQAVGVGFTSPTAADPDRQRALLWDTAAGTVIDLGTLAGDPGAQANEINNAGEVVGGSGMSPGAVGTHAFLWTPTEGMLDLTTLLDASGQGWTLHFAFDINNRGQIVATGIFNDVPQAVLLTLVPEPAGLTLLPLAGITLLRRRRRQSGAARGLARHA